MSVDQTRDFVKHQTPSLDAFLGGKLTISQPAAGFRAGSDSVLLGASVPGGAQAILDLGAGVGTAGLVASVWAAHARVVLAERDPEALDLARANIHANGMSSRVAVAEIDLTASGPERERAGIKANSFDTVIANPPYFAKGKGTAAGGRERDAARHAPAGELDLWVKAAATAAAPRGVAIFILPANRLGDALTSFDRRFGGIEILPIAPRVGEDAGRILVRGIKGSRAGLVLRAPLVLHGPDGNGFAPEAGDILMGRAKLDW